jgi:hypothetical protein
MTVALTLSGCRAVVPPVHPVPEDIEVSLFLIGDAGEQNPREIGQPLVGLQSLASVAPQRSIIVFLGDNVYPKGMPREGDAEWADAQRRLADQIQAIPPGARGVFLPGNHDWSDSEAFGLYSVRLEERVIRSLAGGKDVRMLPGNGCPGPVAIDAGRLRFIAMDTQWWLQDYIVKDSATNCPTHIGEITSLLRQQMDAWAATPGHVTVVGGHHPMMTGGEHGAYCGITGPFRRFGNRSQDIVSRLNRTLRDSLESAFAAHPPIAYAGGHDHNLQVLRGGPNAPNLLVSGAGSPSKVSCAVRLRESLFTSQHRVGFMRIDVMRTKGVLLSVYQWDSRGQGGLAYTYWLEGK